MLVLTATIDAYVDSDFAVGVFLPVLCAAVRPLHKRGKPRLQRSFNVRLLQHQFVGCYDRGLTRRRKYSRWWNESSG